MQQIIVQGGRPLNGAVTVSGAKNAALPVMAAALLVEGTTILHRVPRLRDVETMAAVLRALGVTAEWIGPNSLRLSQHDRAITAVPAELTRQMRGSICVLGPLLATRGAAEVPLPGGCVIGPRPIDLHRKGLAALGATVHVDEHAARARARTLRGARVSLAGPRGSTVLGTANVLMAACLARGRTVIDGAAREPEVQDLARFLRSCGAQIQGIGTKTLVIDGVERLHGVEHSLIPDRIEAATFLAAAAITGGRVALRGVDAGHMRAVIEATERMGVEFVTSEHALIVIGPDRPKPSRLATAPYPGIPTDMQPQLGALLCLASGTSEVREGVYRDRFTHIRELNRMGARVTQRGSCAIIEGVKALRGAPVNAVDIRAGASLVLAALAAEGTTVISGVEQIERGYQFLEEKLRRLGADISRVDAEVAERYTRRTA